MTGRSTLHAPLTKRAAARARAEQAAARAARATREAQAKLRACADALARHRDSAEALPSDGAAAMVRHAREAHQEIEADLGAAVDRARARVAESRAEEMKARAHLAKAVADEEAVARLAARRDQAAALERRRAEDEGER